MIFNKYKSINKEIEGVKVKFIESNVDIYQMSIVANAGTNFENINVENKNIVFPEGTAHLVEHMLFEDAKNNTSFFETYRSLGVNHNAITTNENITFFASSYKSKFLDVVISNVITSMCELDMTNNVFENEKNVVLSELRTNDTLDYFHETRKEFVKGFSNSHDIYGTKETLSNITFEDVKEFYNYNFKKDEITIFVIGKFDDHLIDEISKKINSTFEDIKNRDGIHIFNSKKNRVKNTKPKLVFDQSLRELDSIHVSADQFRRMIAINREDLNMTIPEFKKFIRNFRFSCHFAAWNETKWNEDKLEFIFDVDEEGMLIDYYSSNENTFVFGVIIYSPENKYSKKRIGKRLSKLIEMYQNLDDYIDWNNYDSFIKNSKNAETGKKLYSQFTYSELSQFIYLFGSEDFAIEKEFNVNWTKKLKDINMDNYIDLFISKIN